MSKNELLDEIDYKYWRKGQCSAIYNPANVEITDEYVCPQYDGGVHIFYENEAARIFFIAIIGYVPVGDNSVLWLARADPWFSTSILIIDITDGRGGDRNSQFTDTF